ncbi:glycosyltransferase family 2 protein [Nostoc sp. FACHB-87]|uniref:glycosyltransferase family A protein n=1 Tax=Nostocaceae TaxID=1162 RepID=UPI0016845F11|nr:MULTISPECIES: glycosyltransferase family A protein [Nostocaceae]MBD2457167.1 glycosyltransferase family 2 protein [Nostoc sp. FACHB-87]MBD2476967.1 glycosyltransferase family 2 protein [Anabaena sp. FACHB-83]
MNNKQFLTIVTATRGNYSDYWLNQLLQVKGEVKFILVYPPDLNIKEIDDARVKVLISPYKGEVIQRFIGLINAESDYVMALDDDDFVHPDIIELSTQYFQRFPESWVLRLKIENINHSDKSRIQQDWESLPNLEELEIDKKTAENPFPFKQGNYKGLLEVPIAPLCKAFDFRYVIFPWRKRTDQNGIHFENFNNKIWQTQRVKAALNELSQAMQVSSALKWIPMWSLDRLLGLFIQAKFYQKDTIIGHAMPKPEQIRFIVRDSYLKETRLYLMAEILLVKCYPQYGYLWNLIVWQIATLPRILARGFLNNQMSKCRNQSISN